MCKSASNRVLFITSQARQDQCWGPLQWEKLEYQPQEALERECNSMDAQMRRVTEQNSVSRKCTYEAVRIIQTPCTVMRRATEHRDTAQIRTPLILLKSEVYATEDRSLHDPSAFHLSSHGRPEYKRRSATHSP